jgi:hypothetical protein
MKRVFYTGEGRHWAARVIMDYYTHIWRDENGAETAEYFYDQMIGLKYLDEPAETLTLRLDVASGAAASSADIYYEPARAGEGGFVWYAGLSEYEYFDLSAPYIMGLEWRGQKEEMELALHVESGPDGSAP